MPTCVRVYVFVRLVHYDRGLHEFPLRSVDKEMAQFLIGGDSPVTQGHRMIICQLSVAPLRQHTHTQKKESRKGEESRGWT